VTYEQTFDDVRDTDIVVGVDGSAPAKAALRWSIAQARCTGGRVRAATAWEIPPYAGWPVLPYDDLAVAAGKQLSESVQEAVGAALSTRTARWSSYAARVDRGQR